MLTTISNTISETNQNTLSIKLIYIWLIFHTMRLPAPDVSLTINCSRLGYYQLERQNGHFSQAIICADKKMEWPLLEQVLANKQPVVDTD
jgi:hypothetical protein